MSDGADTPVLCAAEQIALARPDGRPLLQGLSFAIRPGLSVVRGGDGRGKSSLLRLIAGTTTPASGQIRRPARTIFHESPVEAAHDPVVARAWLAQHQARYAAGWLPGLEADLIAAFGLTEHIDKPLFMLSAGSRRKVGLVAAAASAAQLTLLDTPYAALDARSGRLLSELLAEAAADRERAWVIADYELPAALAEVPLAARIELGD